MAFDITNDIAWNIDFMKSFFAEREVQVARNVAMIMGMNNVLVEGNPCSLEDTSSEPSSLRARMKNYSDTEKELYRIHLEIIHAEKLFFEEKSKWMAKNFCPDMDQDKEEVFFSKRRQWEIDFTESHLQPLYKERRTLAQEGSLFWPRAVAFFTKMHFRHKFIKKDEDIFRFLIDIEVKSTWSSDSKGFQLKFTFHKNSFIKNEYLTKTYDITGDNKSITLKGIGSEVNWISSSCPLSCLQRKKSFFTTFFDSYATINPISLNTKTGELEGKVPSDYILGTIFRDKIIPHATFVSLPPSPSVNPYQRNRKSFKRCPDADAGGDNGRKSLKRCKVS